MTMKAGFRTLGRGYGKINGKNASYNRLLALCPTIAEVLLQVQSAKRRHHPLPNSPHVAALALLAAIDRIIVSITNQQRTFRWATRYADSGRRQGLFDEIYDLVSWRISTADDLANQWLNIAAIIEHIDVIVSTEFADNLHERKRGDGPSKPDSHVICMVRIWQISISRRR